MHRLALALGCAGIACSPAAPVPDGAAITPGLGLPASEADVARVFWSAFPDGENLPPGSGTATRGVGLYQRHCQACHGVEGVGGPADRLVGGVGSLGTDRPLGTVGSFWPYATTLFDYIRRSMPYTAPMSLSNDDYYALTAYLLERNEIIGPDDVVDAETLPGIVMPNRDGFVLAYPSRPARYEYGNPR